MNLLKNEFVAIAAYAVGGLLAGGVYKLGATYVDKKQPSQIIEKTEALHTDVMLLALFGRMYEFRTSHEIYFLRALDSADQLLYLSIQMKEYADTVSIDTDKDAFAFFTNCKDNLKLLRRAVDDLPTCKVVLYEELCSRVVEILERYLMEILRTVEKQCK